MIFSSVEFFLFFAIFYLIFLYLKNKGTIFFVFLLVASYFFYMSWEAKFLLVLIFTSVIDYFFGLQIYKTDNKKTKKIYIICSVVANLSLLCYFKYTNFFIDNINWVTNALHLVRQPIGHFNITLPVGISFFTFKSMSYTIDVYRGKFPAERSFLKFATFVAFFPELAAGPIVRAEKMLPQFERKLQPSVPKFIEGTKLFIFGFFKKLFIADMISPYSDNVFAHTHLMTGYEVWVGVMAYTIQIYCDFSGYTDMAIGIAKMMDYDFPENFNIPYLSRSVREFWRRWHISLFSWFTDYVFNPVQISLRDWGKSAIIVGLFVTFFLSGLWHGPAWHFIVFGLLQFVAIVYEIYTRKYRLRVFGILPVWLNNTISSLLTVGYFAFSTIFFRAADFTGAFAILHKLGTLDLHTAYFIPQFYFLLFIFVLGHVLHSYFYDKNKKWKQGKFLESMMYTWMILMMILLAPTHTSPFVYFQF